jgi:hypothetical protein
MGESSRWEIDVSSLVTYKVYNSSNLRDASNDQPFVSGRVAVLKPHFIPYKSKTRTTK